jgi:hypothetical protein
LIEGCRPCGIVQRPTTVFPSATKPINQPTQQYACFIGMTSGTIAILTIIIKLELSAPFKLLAMDYSIEKLPLETCFFGLYVSTIDITVPYYRLC